MAEPILVPGAKAYILDDPVSTRQVLPWWLYCHTIVGTVSSALPGKHYHLYVEADGEFIQRQDLRLRSGASVEMNPYSIAIVAEDQGPAFPPWSGSDVPAYTPQQVKTLILILSWICHRFGIPKSAARTSCLDSAHGVAWHRLGIDGSFPNVWPYWGRQPGCLETSLSTGKPCPGNARITQLVHDIIPAISAPPPPEEDDPLFTNQERQWLIDIHQSVVQGKDGSLGDSLQSRARLVKGDGEDGGWYVTNGLVRRQAVGHQHANFLVDVLGVEANKKDSNDNWVPFLVPAADLGVIPLVPTA